MRRLSPALLFCLVAGTALAANPYLVEGRRLYGALQFSEAIKQLRIARDAPTSGAIERVEVLDLLARCQVAEGLREDAERTYEELLTLAPDTELGRDLSPKILSAFDDAKHHLFEPDYVVLKALPSVPGVARAELVDPWRQVAEIVWGRRAPNETDWKVTPLEAVDHVVSLPLGGEHEEWLAWYLEARRKDGVTLARWGSASDPQIFSTVPAGALSGPGPAPEPTRRRRLAGEVLGVVAVVAAATGGFLAWQSQKDAASGKAEHWADQATSDHSRSLTEGRVAIGAFAGAGAAAVVGTVLFVW